MKIKVVTEDNLDKQKVVVERETDCSLSEAVGVVEDALTAAFGYPVAITASTEFATWTKEGLVNSD
jgi:hypothetical protein